MIYVFRTDHTNAFTCQDTDDLFRTITDMENAKLLEDHIEFGQSAWSFIYYTAQQAAKVHARTPQEAVTPLLQEAFDKALGFVEICTGDYTKPEEILLTGTVDLDKLKKQWCAGYCKAHGYCLAETASSPNSTRFDPAEAWQAHARANA